MNPRTLVGHTNRFDDDAEESGVISLINYEPDVYESELHLMVEEDALTNVNLNETFPQLDNTGQPTTNDTNWTTYNATKLQQPISVELSQSAATSSNTATQNKENKENIHTNSYKTPKSQSRRRPTTIIKPLTSSDIAKKYDLLMDKTLMLVQGQLKHMEKENALIIKKRKLEIELLELELKKKQLN
ncbi:hypothetical protein RN001_005841 [Aquatica leii]|uniref:Uncharacterized protein n=1 Tax=Aquatica leii TaxID=1421715 RepID=A0AAN7PCD5_9COLE|nr:hypothetical protein RN001_005841 [Aquatica leii]